MKSDRIYKIDKITSGSDMEGMWLAFKLIRHNRSVQIAPFAL